MKEFTFVAKESRTINDPSNNKVKCHLLYCPVETVPHGVPLDPNPRKNQNINKFKWKEIKSSLFNDDGQEKNLFHLKNKGITIIADSCTFNGRHGNLIEYSVQLEDSDSDELEELNAKHGILDGGHTYKLITENSKLLRDVKNKDNTFNQFVKVYVYVGVDKSVISQISKGLNTGYEVKAKSILEFQDSFEWVKKSLDGCPNLLHNISFSENDNKYYDIESDIAGMLEIFTTIGDKHPVSAYSSPGSLIKRFDKKCDEYKKLSDILPDIIQLYEMVQCGRMNVVSSAAAKAAERGHFAIKSHKKGGWMLPATGQKAEYLYHKGVSIPILAAFRCLVKLDSKTNKYRWCTKDGFDSVKLAHRNLAVKFFNMIQDSGRHNKSADHFGKDNNFWSALYGAVCLECFVYNKGKYLDL